MRYSVWLGGCVCLGVSVWVATAAAERPDLDPMPEPRPEPVLAGVVLRAEQDPNRLLFEELDLPLPVPTLEVNRLDIGVDADFGRRLLEEQDAVDAVRPESLVGL